MLDAANGLAPGDPARMAARIIASVDTQPAPLRMVFGSPARDRTLATLRKRIADFEAQTGLAVSTDFPPGEMTNHRSITGSPPSSPRLVGTYPRGLYLR